MHNAFIYVNYVNVCLKLRNSTVTLFYCPKKAECFHALEVCHNLIIKRIFFMIAVLTTCCHQCVTCVDVVVGAPFEGNGAVYVFRGSFRGLIVDFSQRIYASDLPSGLQPLRSFGHSLSAGMDMDLNGYPDLVVGSFGVDRIVMLRSRPVINVMSTLSSTPSKINLWQTGELRCRDRTLNSSYCFEIEACFFFTAKPVERYSLCVWSCV